MAHPAPARRTGHVLVFAPHPDDDVIACGGTIIAKVSQGTPVEVVFSTDGSMSHAAVLGIVRDPAPDELATIRRGEALAAAQVMGLTPVDLHFLGLPDTRLADCMDEFRASVTALLAERAEVTEIYLPHEIRELNADHRLTGEGVLDCLATLGLTPRLRKYVVWDESTEAEFAFVNRQPSDRAAGSGERLVTVDIATQLPAKLEALAQHRTQVSLYSPTQVRPVVPEAFVQRVCARPVERFWVGTDETDPDGPQE